MRSNSRVKRKLRQLQQSSCEDDDGSQRLCPHCARPVSRATFFRHKKYHFNQQKKKWRKSDDWKFNAQLLRNDPRYGEHAYAEVFAFLRDFKKLKVVDFEELPEWQSEAAQLESAAYRTIRRRHQHTTSGEP